MTKVRAVLAGLGAGWGLWTATEYAMHRWAMHGPWRRQPVAAEHLRHHAEPLATDPVLRALSYVPVAVGAAGLATVGRLAGAPVAGKAAGMAFLAGYGSYEQLHWRIHHRQATNPLERWLRGRHLVHHQRAGRNYGVTTGVWDHVLGTAAPPQRAA